MIGPRTTYRAVLAGVILWCLFIVLAPLLTAAGEPWTGVGRSMYDVFAPVCHQVEGRSPVVAGEPLAVCTRCSAIYFGFLVGLLVYPFLHTLHRRPPRLLLAAAVLPMLVDVALGILGLHEVTPGTRVVTGATFGVLAPLVVLPPLIEAIQQLSTSSRSRHQQKGLSDA